MSVYISVCLSLYLSVCSCVSVCLSACLPACLVCGCLFLSACLRRPGAQQLLCSLYALPFLVMTSDSHDNERVLPPILPPALCQIFSWSRSRAGGGGRYTFDACLSHVLLTMHHFRGGAPFPLLIETPPTFGRSLRSFRMLQKMFAPDSS